MGITDPDAYIFSRRVSDFGAGSTKFFFIENPADSDRTIFVKRIIKRAQRRTFFDAYLDVTEDSPGSDVEVIGSNPGSSKEFVGNAREDGTYSNLGKAIIETLVPAAGTGSSGPGSWSSDVDDIELFRIPPGHNALLRLINDSTSDGDVAITLFLYQ